MNAEEERLFYSLRKLAEADRPLNMTELGTYAGPQSIRNWAARGLIKVEVVITVNGATRLSDLTIKRQRVKIRGRHKARMDAATRLSEVA